MKQKIFIIAEVGNLHNGSLNKALEFVKKIRNCGADAIKFQTHIFEAESLPDAPNPPYFKKESRKKYFEKTSFNLDEWKEIKKYTEKKCKIEFISSVFSNEAVDWLEEVGVKKYKIPSGEVTNIPLLIKVAKTGKSVILSSGMSSWKELDLAVDVLRKNKAKDITILQCSSIYPCPLDKTGMNVMTGMKKRYNLPIGFSDHTLGYVSSIISVTLGARVLEKHFTLSKDMYGSDAKHSLEPQEFREFVEKIRETEKVIYSNLDKDKVASNLKDMKRIFEKSIIANRKIRKGDKITLDMLGFKKPGDGLRPSEYKNVIGKIAKIDIDINTKINKEMLEQ